MGVIGKRKEKAQDDLPRADRRRAHLQGEGDEAVSAEARAQDVDEPEHHQDDGAHDGARSVATEFLAIPAGAHRSKTGESAHEAQMRKGTTHRWERGGEHVRPRGLEYT